MQNGHVYWWGKFSNQHLKVPTKLEGVLNNVKISKACCTLLDILLLGEIGDVYWWENGKPGPQLIESIQDKVITDISAGLSHFLLLTYDGLVFVCGRGEFGQLVKIADSLNKLQLNSTFRDVENKSCLKNHKSFQRYKMKKLQPFHVERRLLSF